ncbi:MAG: recombinase RecT [Oscillospiraceae bacterium]
MNNLPTTHTQPRGNSLAPTGQDNDRLGTYLGRADIKTWLNNVLGNQEEAARFVANITSAVAASPALAECTSASIVSAGLMANSLKLSMSASLGHCYLIPFKDNKNKRVVATFVLGYRGYEQLAIRSGQYKKIEVVAIKQGELIKYDRIRNEAFFNPITDDIVREQTPTIGYYAYFELVNGYKKEIYWSKEKMQLHADKYSKAYSRDAHELLLAGKIPASDMWKYSSYWYSDFDGMAYKTMIRQLLSKHGVMSIDMQKAVEADDDYTKEEMFAGDDGAPLPPAQQLPATPETKKGTDDTVPENGEQGAENFDEFFEGIDEQQTIPDAKN